MDKKINSFFMVIIMSFILGNQGFCSNTDTVPFGNIIGQSQKTIAYSNNNNDTVSHEHNFSTHNNQQICTGMKWQCVEFARRWLIENRNLTFPDIDYAVNIWNLKFAESLVKTGTKLNFFHLENKTTGFEPQAGDLLIYDTSFAKITGHVAIIVGIDENSVIIGEQNYNNKKWENENYARRLTLNKTFSNKGLPLYEIVDHGVIGWMRLPEIE